MDEVFGILFVGALGLGILIGPWILLWRSSLRRKRERTEDQTRFGDLTRRVYLLEDAFKSIQSPHVGEPRTEAEVASEHVARQTAPAITQIPPPTIVTEVPPSVVQDDVAGSSQDVSLAAARSTAASPPIPRTPVVPPTFAPKVARPSLVDRLKSALDLEEIIGTNWLPKLGISLVVLGIVFLVRNQFKTLPPIGKVLTGYLIGALMLGAGIWFERKDRYRILARAGVGGGWALLFFTTYAMYHVPAAHVLTSQAFDLVLMLIVAGAMVWHTLRYNSQIVTGLALLLAFLTVTISHDTVYSLSAGVVLALALVAIVRRTQWFEMEVFGILASYLNHYIWLRPIIEPMQGHRHAFPEFTASAGLLLLYWAIFRLSYVFRKTDNSYQERISTAAALLNTTLLLLLFKYQSTHPEWAFWALLAIGAIETALGQLPVTKRRRSAVIVLSTLGVVLLIAAFPFRYSGAHLTILWLLEAEALLLIGVRTREIIFRRLGSLAAVLVAGQMIAIDAARIYGIRTDDADLSSHPRMAILFGIAAAVFYANAHWIASRWKNLFASEFDERFMDRMSYVGGLMALIGAWIAFPQNWTAVAWAVLGLAMAWTGQRFRVRELAHQAYAVTAATFLRTAVINFADTTPWRGFSLRLITILLVAILLYASARWSVVNEWQELEFGFGPLKFPLTDWIRGVYTWAGTLLLGLLAWYELRPVSVAVVWVVGGLLLFEAGFGRKSLSLRLQTYGLFLAGFLRIFFVNLNASGSPGELSPRFYTIIPLALAFFYAQWRLHAERDSLFAFERTARVESVCSYLGTISVVALMRFELESDWVAAAWAALVVVLLALAWRSQLRVFLDQALLLSLGVLFRTSMHNFYERSYFPAPFWQSRLLCSGVVIALLFLSLPIAFRLRRKDDKSPHSGLVGVFGFLTRRPEQFLFFIAAGLLTVLLALEMDHGMVTVAWGVEGVAIFLLALWMGERSFRLAGLGLLLLCVGKIILVDVWQLNPRDRYLTFIVLGGALLLVSFLYSKNREAIRKYL